MLSVIIATLDSEPALLPTLVALVPAAMDGLVGEVIVADGGSRDDTAAVADAAGCKFKIIEGPPGRRLRTSAASARGAWLLFLRPGTILDASWIDAARRFADRSSRDDRAAVFRRGTPQPTLREVLLLLAGALGGRPRPEQGLLIMKRFYDSLGGHSERAADAETELLRRIGRRRLVTLSAAAVTAEILD